MSAFMNNFFLKMLRLYVLSLLPDIKYEFLKMYLLIII